MAALAYGTLADAAQVETVRLMTVGANVLLRMKGAVRTSFLVALRAL